MDQRVRDYREQQLHKLPNVEIYFDSDLGADDVLAFGFPRVVVATGAAWRADGVGHHWTTPMPIANGAKVLSPDDIMSGTLPEGKRVIVWDDDHYYMGGVMAELMAEKGYDTTYVTPASEASTWTRNTMEQPFIQARMMEKGVWIRSFANLDDIGKGEVTVSCVFTGKQEQPGSRCRPSRDVDAPQTTTSQKTWKPRKIEWARRRHRKRITTIGDAEAPATIAHAVYAGRRYAEELDGPPITRRRGPLQTRNHQPCSDALRRGLFSIVPVWLLGTVALWLLDAWSGSR